MLVQEIMTKNVVTIENTACILDAYKKYRDAKVGCLLVTNNTQCIGIVTERDLIERSIDKNRTTTLIQDIMSTNLHTIHPLDTIEKALEYMKHYHIKKLPVVANNELKGIITLSDIANAGPDISKRFMESWIQPRWQD